MSHSNSHASIEAYKYCTLGLLVYSWQYWHVKLMSLFLLTFMLSCVPFYPLVWYQTAIILSCLLVIKYWKYEHNDSIVYYE